MENTSLTSDVWDDITTSASQCDDLTVYLRNIRDLALKVIYIIIGSVGIIGNLFVLIVFILFIKITDRVWHITIKVLIAFKLAVHDCHKINIAYHICICVRLLRMDVLKIRPRTLTQEPKMRTCMSWETWTYGKSMHAFWPIKVINICINW